MTDRKYFINGSDISDIAVGFQQRKAIPLDLSGLTAAW